MTRVSFVSCLPCHFLNSSIVFRIIEKIRELTNKLVNSTEMKKSNLAPSSTFRHALYRYLLIFRGYLQDFS